MTTSDTLHDAADLIERTGLWKEAESIESGDGFCAVGAVQHIAGGPVAAKPACDALKQHIGVSFVWDIFAWNDDPDRTESEVVEVLRAAAVIARAREDQDAAFETYAGQVTA